MRLALIALAALACSGPALAQSPRKAWGEINCTKAKAPDEKTICATTSLLQRDAQMSVEYGLLRGFLAMGSRGALVDDQKDWLVQRTACKADKTCLEKTYDNRMIILEAGLERVKSFGPF
jgi:uncharacterized protein